MKKKAKKQLSALNKDERSRVASAIDSIAIDPFVGKQLEGKLKGYWSIRVWPLRIVYEIRKKEVIVAVVYVGHRKDVYKKTKKK